MWRGNFEYYVVTRGRQPGIYKTWDECKVQVLGFRNNEYKGFNSYADAVAAFNSSMENQAKEEVSQGSRPSRSGTACQNALTQGQKLQLWSARSRAKTPNAYSCAQGVEVAPSLNMHEFVITKSMEKWLDRTCDYLYLPRPIFYRDERYIDNGGLFYGFSVVLPSNNLGIQLAVVGRYATDEQQAREDAAFSLLSQLLATTGMNIFDFNYGHVNALQYRVAELENENASLKNQVVALTHLLPK